MYFIYYFVHISNIVTAISKKLRKILIVLSLSLY